MVVKNFVVSFSEEAAHELRTHFFQVHFNMDRDTAEIMAIVYEWEEL